MASQGDPGVQEKWVGTFTERNLRLGFLRLDAGAVYQAGQFPSIEILFQIKGQVSTGGRKYGPETGYEFLANEGPVPVEAVEPTEFLRRFCTSSEPQECDRATPVRVTPAPAVVDAVPLGVTRTTPVRVTPEGPPGSIRNMFRERTIG